MNADEVMDQRDQGRELARLRQVNAEMLDALQRLLASDGISQREFARAVIAKVEGK